MPPPRKHCLRYFGVLALRWPDAHHRVHHRRRGGKKILDHLGVDSRPPRITPARGPPLWDQQEQDVAETFDIDVQAERVPASEFQFDQRIDW